MPGLRVIGQGMTRMTVNQAEETAVLRRIFVTALTVAAAGAATPSAAQADVFFDYVSAGNTYGFYYCNIWVSANRQYFDYRCTVTDTECDDHGVYVSIKMNLGNRGVDEGAWERRTNNAGGCNKKSSKSGRIDSGLGSRDISDIEFVLTRDDRPGYDDRYDDTIESSDVPYE
jgi:hypothetical protein